MASIRLLLPPGIEYKLKDVQPGQWPPLLAPAAALAAASYPQYIHVLVSAPVSYGGDLRFVGLAWGERCVLDVTVQDPFGSTRAVGGATSETGRSEEEKARVTETSFQELEGFVMVRIRIPPSSGMLEADPPGVPVVFLLLDPNPNAAEKPSVVSTDDSQGPVHDHGFLLVSDPEACAELLQLWQSMLGAVAAEQSRHQEQGQEVQDAEREASRALESLLDLNFSGAPGSSTKDKVHWSRAWRSFMLPYIHDMTGLFYTIHHLPLLQHELSEKMKAAGLAPTRQPPVPPKQQPGASDEELAEVAAQSAPAAAAAAERAAAQAARTTASPAEEQPTASEPTEPPTRSPTYTNTSTGVASPSAGLSYLLRPVSRGETVYESVAKAVVSTDWLSSRTPQEASSREMATAPDSSNLGLGQEGQRVPAPADPTPTPASEHQTPRVFLREDPALKIAEAAEDKAVQIVAPGTAAAEASSSRKREPANFDPTALLTGILDLAMDALPLVDQLMGFLQAQPQEKAALKRLVGICAVTIRESLIWCNDQISASLSPAAMKQQAAAPSPFSADGLQPTLHRLSSYLSSPTNSPRRWSASVSSLQAELLQQPDVAPAAEMERRPSYSSLLEGAYPSRLLHDAAVTALRDESLQRWQAMQGTSPGREEVQWGRELQQQGFLTDIPMQIRAALSGFRGLTNNEGLDKRAEDAYTDQSQAAQSVGQSTSTSLIVLQLAVSFFYLRALPGCQVRNIRGVLCFLPPIVKALAMEAASNPAWLQWLWHQAHGLSRSKRALQVFLVQAALLIQCLWRIWLLVLPYTYGEPTHGVDSAALYANSIVLLVESLADPLTVAVVPVQKVWLLLPLSSLLSSATMLQAGTTKAIISVLLSILSSLFVIVATNVHRRRAFVRASCQGEAAF